MHVRKKRKLFIQNLLGLILVPNGEHIGYVLGDTPSHTNETIPLGHRTTAKLSEEETLSEPVERASSHSWGIFFTILGTVLLDFDADACQSPARAYLLDVTIPGKQFITLCKNLESQILFKSIIKKKSY